MELLKTILGALPDVPNYLIDVFQRHTIVGVILLVIFAFSLLFSNKVAYYLRMIFIIAAIGFGAFGFYRGTKKNGFHLFLTCVVALLVMIIFRGVRAIIASIRQRRIDARIEERALEKAAKRRGNFKNKQGYSGEQRPIVDDEKPAEMSKDEIRDVVSQEWGDNVSEDVKDSTAEVVTTEVAAEAMAKEAEAAKAAEAAETSAEEGNEETDAPAEDISEETVVPADDVREEGDGTIETAVTKEIKVEDVSNELLANLQNLLDNGILSQEEFDAKKAELFNK